MSFGYDVRVRDATLWQITGETVPGRASDALDCRHRILDAGDDEGNTTWADWRVGFNHHIDRIWSTFS